MLPDVKPVVRPVERLRDPELGREILAPFVLHDPCGIGRYAVEPAVGAVNMDLVERTVREPVAVHGVGQKDAPYARSILVEPQFGSLPVVEVPEEIDVAGAGQPFAEPPPFERCIVLPAEIAVAVGVIDKGSCRAADLREPSFIGLVPRDERLLDGLQPRIALDHLQSLFVSHRRCKNRNDDTPNITNFIEQPACRRNFFIRRPPASSSSGTALFVCRIPSSLQRGPAAGQVAAGRDGCRSLFRSFAASPACRAPFPAPRNPSRQVFFNRRPFLRFFCYICPP